MLMVDHGLETDMMMDAGLTNGLNIYCGKCANKNVAKALGLEFINVNELIWFNLYNYGSEIVALNSYLAILDMLNYIHTHENEAIAVGKKGQEVVTKHFSIERRVINYMNLYYITG